MARFSEDVIKQVKRLLAADLKQQEIAAQTGVSRGLVSDIKCGRVHANVEFDDLPLEAVTTPESPPTRDGNVLVIGDLHNPFCLKGYLDFCLRQHSRFDCSTVVFIGDIIDNHYASYHETDPDGMGGGDELEMAIQHTQPWVRAFPQAYVTVGNHDRMVMRKAFSGGIPKKWIKSYNEVLEAPDWQFVQDIVIDNVQYIHGECGTARVKAKNDKFSTVQGHLHTQAYVEFLPGRDVSTFGMQVGCGIDRDTYAMAYAQMGPRPAIGCGVVLDGGRLPLFIPGDF